MTVVRLGITDDLAELVFRDDPFDLLVIDTAVRFLPLPERDE